MTLSETGLLAMKRYVIFDGQRSSHPCNAGWPRRLRNGARTRSIQASPFAQGCIAGGGCPARARIIAAGPGGFASGGGWLGGGRLRDDGGHHGFDKHAVAHGAVKVSLAADAAIVLARLVLQLDADPLAKLEAGLASEADDTLAAIVQLDRLAGFEIWHYGCLIGRASIVAPVWMVCLAYRLVYEGWGFGPVLLVKVRLMMMPLRGGSPTNSRC